MVNRLNLSLIKTNKGNSITDLSDQSPVLLVFLRHFGCVFCKESLLDISKLKEKFLKEGIKIVFVHMSDNDTAEAYFKKYNFKNLEHVSDGECKVYGLFGLVKGTFSQLFGLKTWIRGFEIAATKQIMPTMQKIGDGFQMPGIFLIKDGAIIDGFKHHSVADKPDYETFIQMCHI
ncbi:MAG: AhpC/TSA family protein [Saprospiraceae bacterium]|nr:AhpC/TSA family protein [Saprospiraceae bacterium]